MKKKVIIAILLLTTIALIMSGCTTKPKDLNVEANLALLAETQGAAISDFIQWRGGLKLNKLMTGRYELIDSESGTCVYYIDNARIFYQDDDPYKNFVYEEVNDELNPKYLKTLEEAKILACRYIESSNIIKEEEKQGLKEAIQNVTIHYITIPSDSEDVGTVMRTHGTHIYLSKGYESDFNVATFLHELVHVISNETNRGSKYEMSAYRFSAINEGMTELITRQILIDAGKEREILQNCSYVDYFPYTLALMRNVDLLKVYFYSDNYDSIFRGLNRDWVDVYYMLVDWGSSSDLYQGVPYWAFAQF